MTKTLVFVPTYNEAQNVEQMVTELLALPIDADLLFLDDGSPDGTGEILDRLAASNSRVSVKHRPDKLGIGSAHLEGIRAAYEAGYDILVTLDCDFTHKPEDILELLRHAETFPVTAGSRYLTADSLPGWNLLRRSLTSLGHIMTTRLLKIPFDATGALRTYDLRRIPREAFELVRARGYGFFFESMYILVNNGFSVKEIPIVLPARTYGSSKMTLKETFRSGTRLLSLWRQSVLDPSSYLLPPPPLLIDGGLGDRQGWDRYWTDKAGRTSRTYDWIATIYRTSVIRSQLRRFIARTFPRGASLLHAGCGSGQVDEGLHEHFAITAVDLSAPALELYRRHNPRARSIRHADVLDLPFPDSTFDGVYNLGVLEHFTRDEIRRALGEARRVLKPTGRLLLFWPHKNATSVAVLGVVHKLMRRFGDATTRLHPPEISLLESRAWIEALLIECGFQLVQYSFGPRDLFVQAVIVAEKHAAA